MIQPPWYRNFSAHVKSLEPVREGAPSMLNLLYEKNGGNLNAGR